MVKLNPITKHFVVDTTSQKENRSSVFGGLSLEKYSIAIDSGITLKIGKELLQELQSSFNLPVKYLFLTHTHSDHRGGMEAFKDSILIMSQKSKENMPSSIKVKKYNIETFEEKFTLEENGLKVNFLKVGGHTIGFSVAYFPNEKVLFGGDLFFVGSVNYGLPFMSFYQDKPKKTGNPEEYLTAFKTFLGMDLKVIVPGHGELVLNPQGYLKSQISFFESLKKYFKDAINDGESLEEIELPMLEPIKQAFIEVETKTPKSAAKRFLENYLNHLKNSFYNFYSGK